MTYEAWRITYQSSEQAARAAYNTVEELNTELIKAKKFESMVKSLIEDNNYLRGELNISKGSITSLLDSSAELVAGLEQLACLGNSDTYGNSIGNLIAQAALGKARMK